MSSNDIVIVGSARTPIGSFLGSLAPVPAPKLGAAAIAEAVKRSGVDPASVEQVYMGNVLQAGIGQAPARQAALFAGLPKSAGAMTVHKVCGSGMKAIMTGANDLRVGEFEVVVAGGMESMSNSPHILEGSRNGFRMGHAQLADSMIKDGLWDPYGDKHMGNCAEMCVRKFSFTREEQDAFALESYRRARAAVEAGDFAKEIAAVLIPQKKGDPRRFERDEEPFAAPLDKMPSLRPAFEKEGTITAANASKINDGAAALVLTTAERAAKLGLKPIARILGQASHAQEPDWFTTAPAEAVKKLLAKSGKRVGDIDLWEVNEAFSVVAMTAIRELELDPAKVNVRGGAVALGHPIGASGTRIVVTLLAALEAQGKALGAAAICIGGGEATALLVERLG
jgi:acetyl-CoA C-acetyltransferase